MLALLTAPLVLHAHLARNRGVHVFEELDLVIADKKTPDTICPPPWITPACPITAGCYCRR
jgi:hypothetical protein